MRKIRSRGTAYRSIALESIARSNDRFEEISHLVYRYQNKGNEGNQGNGGGVDVNLDVQRREEVEVFIQSFGSVVHPSLCYFRSIPVKTVLSRFSCTNEEAPTIQDIFNHLVLVKHLSADGSNNNATAVNTTSNHGQDDGFCFQPHHHLHSQPKSQSKSQSHLLEFGQRLEPIRQLCEANTIITTTMCNASGSDSKIDTHKYKYSKPSLLHHKLQLPKTESQMNINMNMNTNMPINEKDVSFKTEEKDVIIDPCKNTNIITQLKSTRQQPKLSSLDAKFKWHSSNDNKEIIPTRTPKRIPTMTPNGILIAKTFYNKCVYQDNRRMASTVRNSGNHSRNRTCSVQALVKVRKQQWQKDCFYRNSKRIVDSQRISSFNEQVVPCCHLFKASMNPRDYYIRNDSKLPVMNNLNLSKKPLFRRFILPDDIHYTIFRDRFIVDKRRHKQSSGTTGWKESVATNDIHKFMKAKESRGRKKRILSISFAPNKNHHHVKSVETMLEKSPSRIQLEDPQLPNYTRTYSLNSRISTVRPSRPSLLSSSSSSSSYIMSLPVFNQLPLRKISPPNKHKSLSSSVDVFQYRTLGTIMIPYNLMGGVHIQHSRQYQLSSSFIKKKNDRFQPEAHSFAALFQLGWSIEGRCRKGQNDDYDNAAIVSTKNHQCQSISCFMRTKRNPTLDFSRKRKNGLDNFAKRTRGPLSITIFAFAGPNCTKNGKIETIIHDARTVFSSLLKSFEAVQSISVEARGEFLHLLSKSQELKSEIDIDGGSVEIKSTNKLMSQGDTSKQIVVPVPKNVDEYKASKGLKRKDCERVSSQDMKREHKKRKRKKKDKKKKRSSHYKKKKKEKGSEEGVDIIKVPSLHVGSTPMVITHAKYEVTSVHNTNANGCHQQIYRSGVEVKKVVENVEQHQRRSDEKVCMVPRIAVPSFPVGMPPVTVLRGVTAARSSNYSHGENDAKILDKEVVQPRTVPCQVTQANGQLNRNSQVICNGNHSMLLPHGVTPLVSKLRRPQDSLAAFQNKYHNVGIGEDAQGESIIAPSNIEVTRSFPRIDNNNSIEMCSMSTDKAQDGLALDNDEAILTILCSEHFLEYWSQAAAELSSGRWTHNIVSREESEENYTTLRNRRTILRDCALVDICGVDIEVPNNSAIKIISLASWSDQTKGNDKSNPKTVIKDFVQLVATNRYKKIHLLFVIDSLELSPHLTDIANLQNAVVKQTGCPCDDIYIQYVLPNILSTTVATIVSDYPQNPHLSKIMFESKLLERAHFLLSLIPTLTALDSILLLYQGISMPFKNQISRISNLQDTNMDRISAQQLNLALSSSLRNIKEIYSRF